MKNIKIYLTALVLMSYGCTTVKVIKVTKPTDQGIRYSLGRPHILATPSPSGDGTYTAEVIYLPDESETYAIQSSTFLAKNTMEISVDASGILKKIDWTRNTDATVSEATKSLGEIAKSEFDRTKKLKEDKEAKDELKKQKVKDLQESLTTSKEAKQVDLNIAKKDLASLQALYKGSDRTAEIREKIRQLGLTITRLEAEIKNLEAKLQTANTQYKELNDSFNEALPQQKAWGPVLYKIVESGEGGNLKVDLVAVNYTKDSHQLQIETSDKARDTTKVVTYDADGQASIDITLPVEIKSIDKSQSTISAKSGPNPQFTKITCTLVNQTLIKLEFDAKNIPRGAYNIKLTYKYGENDEGYLYFDVNLK